MILDRRQFLVLGGGGLAALSTPSILRAAVTAVIEMRGTARGERVWFSIPGLLVEPGSTVRFVNRDLGNSHTATAYHPEIFGRLQRIPEGAAPWDSGFLLPDETFEVTLMAPGVHDYYCVPHEQAGMVGRIVVGRPDREAGWQGPAPLTDDLPEAAAAAFPSVEEILAEGQVLQEDA